MNGVLRYGTTKAARIKPTTGHGGRSGNSRALHLVTKRVHVVLLLLFGSAAAKVFAA